MDRLEKVMRGLDPDAPDDEIVDDGNEMDSVSGGEYNAYRGGNVGGGSNRDQSREY